MMSKRYARETLEKYIREHGGVLPLQDAIVLEHKTDFGIEQFTFKYLLCIAYDLKLDSKL